MAEAPNIVCFALSEEAFTEDYYGSSNIGFHVLTPSANSFMDIEVNVFHVSSRTSANSIYHVRFHSFPREENPLFFPSIDAGEVGFNALVWNVRGLRMGNSSNILRDLVSSWNLSIVVLTETRVLGDATSRNLIGSFGLDYWRAYNGLGRRGSVGVQRSRKRKRFAFFSFHRGELRPVGDGVVIGWSKLGGRPMVDKIICKWRKTIVLGKEEAHDLGEGKERLERECVVDLMVPREGLIPSYGTLVHD
ncbi:uncharacterized protein G2W53_018755 [Senna tora]|uniref:Endonuclease/exonuclease/phosphatase domain-containing protein n=1 Tax=Senna tora TaxID=362788 RepID=A0A834TVX2_9FABA|nr:uncharacterized protein G2W53_018755 [Senna tora]